jgi:hypothetical protein
VAVHQELDKRMPTRFTLVIFLGIRYLWTQNRDSLDKHHWQGGHDTHPALRLETCIIILVVSVEYDLTYDQCRDRAGNTRMHVTG